MDKKLKLTAHMEATKLIAKSKCTYDYKETAEKLDELVMRSLEEAMCWEKGKKDSNSLHLTPLNHEFSEWAKTSKTPECSFDKTFRDIAKIPDFKNEKEMAEFWDTHSVADFLDELEEVKDEIDPEE